MKEITNDEVLNILDCWMNPNSEVDCKSCPLHKLPKGTCRERALEIIRNRIVMFDDIMELTGLEEFRMKTINRFADRTILNLSSILEVKALESAEMCIFNLVRNEENGL